jgi:hypothetical protein
MERRLGPETKAIIEAIHRSTFKFTKLDEDGTLNVFETSQAKTAPPTLLLDLELFHPIPQIKSGIINRVHYRLNPTNAVTYTLRLWDATVLNPYELNMHMLYESPAAQADDTDYDREVTIPFLFAIAGKLFYSIEWTGAPGNTTGFISVEGEKID